MVKSVFVIPMLDGSFVQFYFWVFLSGVLVCHVSATSPTPRGRLQKSLLSGVTGFAVCDIFLSSDAITGRVGLSSLNGWHRPALWCLLFSLLLLIFTTHQTPLPSRVFRSWPLRPLGKLGRASCRER